MNKKTSPYLSGIRTIADLRLRCFCDKDTGCWIWAGSVQKSRQGGRVEPRVWLADEEICTTIGRAAWTMGRKTKLAKGWNVWRQCRNDLCGNPGHLMAGTKAEWGAWVTNGGYLRGEPERRLINRRIQIDSGNTSLTPELAQWVRESQQTGREVAHALDNTAHVISAIRTGRTFSEVRPSSVFTWSGSVEGR